MLRVAAGASDTARLFLLFFALTSLNAAARADQTYVYAVQLSATIQTAPPQITLSWLPDPYGTEGISVYRKAKEDTSWGASIALLDGSTTNFTDTDVSVGGAYEYQFVRAATLGYTAYGYIYAGIQAPMLDQRGTLILIVETNATAGLTNELTRLRSDLVGDGWHVIAHGVSSNDSPSSVKAVIDSDYDADPTNVDAVFLFGHVPILESGDLNYDTHLTRAMPADAYYGDVLDDWPDDGDPTNRPSFLPSDVALMVGRVDFFNMPGLAAPSPWPSETELLRNYLNKDHRWRQKLFTVPRRALMGNSRGDEDGDATAASGYRNFQPFVGPGNIIEANVDYEAPDDERWISLLTSGSYLWAYGNGGGSPDGCGALGTQTVAGVPGYLRSPDIVAGDARAVFVMMFGSWFGEWDLQDDLMRAFLATPTMGLACCLAGVPHWYLHHMALGETIGYGTRLTMNNSTLYKNDTNELTRAVYVALMGDPTLRMEPIAPASSLSAVAGIGQTTLTWSPSADSVVGYHIYRAPAADGPFVRLTASSLPGLTYVDSNPPPGPATYMVRAVALETNPSGSYFDPSEGTFVSVENAISPPLTVSASLTANGINLQWPTAAGAVYRVLAAASLDAPTWNDISGPILGTGTTTNWTDPATASLSQRFYRVLQASN